MSDASYWGPTVLKLVSIFEREEVGEHVFILRIKDRLSYLT